MRSNHNSAYVMTDELSCHVQNYLDWIVRIREKGAFTWFKLWAQRPLVRWIPVWLLPTIRGDPYRIIIKCSDWEKIKANLRDLIATTHSGLQQSARPHILVSYFFQFNSNSKIFYCHSKHIHNSYIKVRKWQWGILKHSLLVPQVFKL